MRIAYLAAGAAGMYCGACHRDLALIRQLLARGHEVDILPLYTPLRADVDIPPTARVFYGGVSCYLAQMGRAGAWAARVFDGVLSSRPVLGLVSRFAVSTDPTELGPLTVSVLSGKEGRQAGALKQLLAHLQTRPPEVICLTNSLLSGIAPEVKRQLKVPVVCSLQGEETFVDGLGTTHAEQARQWMRRNAQSIDLFLATSDAAAQQMSAYLNVDPTQVRVARPGLEIDRHPVSSGRPHDPFVIGYLSVIAPRKGLRVLVEAWRQLVLEQKRIVKLRVAGQVLDRWYWQDVLNLTRGTGLEGQFEYVGELDRAEKLSFFHRCSAFVLPSVTAEARGLAAMEAMACGVPAILPQSGVFPELVNMTGGGVLVPPRDALAAATALARWMDAPEEADEAGRKAADGIRRCFTAELMTDRVEAVFRELVTLHGPGKE